MLVYHSLVISSSFCFSGYSRIKVLFGKYKIPLPFSGTFSVKVKLFPKPLVEFSTWIWNFLWEQTFNCTSNLFNRYRILQFYSCGAGGGGERE